MRLGLCAWALALLMQSTSAQQMQPALGITPPVSPSSSGELRRGRELLQTKQFGAAKNLFGAFLRTHPGEIQAELGRGDAELGLHELEAAEMTYRQITAQQPELWQAHKNLVVVEAELGRWEEFDRERTVLRLARERGAPGISARESDVIDSFEARGEHWVVRAYFEPVGRSRTLYNFERFSATGKVETYVSLEDAAAAQAALTPKDVRVGPSQAAPVSTGAGSAYALNFYTGSGHGTIARYGNLEPRYEQVRADVLHWVRRGAATSRRTP